MDTTAVQTPAQERAARFLHRIAEQATLFVEVITPKKLPKPIFVKAVGGTVAILALATATQVAGLNTPSAVMQINGQDPITVESIEDLAGRAQTLNPDLMAAITHCLDIKIGQGLPVDPVKRQLALADMHASVKVNNEIEQWVKETGGDVQDAVAALCERPSDWQGQLRDWDNSTESFDALQRRLVRKYGSDAVFQRLGARADAMRMTLGDAAAAQTEQEQRDGAQAVKVRWTTGMTFGVGALAAAGAAAAYYAHRRQPTTVMVQTVPGSAPQALPIGPMMNGASAPNAVLQQQALQRQIQNEFSLLNNLRVQEAQVLRQMQSSSPYANQYASNVNRLNGIRIQEQNLVRQMRQQGVSAQAIESVLNRPPVVAPLVPAIVPPVSAMRMAP